MPLGQGFLNSWLKVNSKHVVIPNKNDREGKAEGQRQASRSSARKNSVGTPRMANTIKRIEEESSQVIRRRSIKKNKRRFQRTVSASDLIRNEVSGEGSKRFVESEDVLKIFGSIGSISAGTLGSSKRSTRKEEHKEYQQVESSPQTATKPLHDDEEISSLVETIGSLRFVAGFFGADIETLSAGTNDRDLNKSARSGPHVPNNDSISLSSRGGMSLPAKIRSRSLGGAMGQRFPPNIFALDSSDPPEKSRECAQLEAELTSAREDLEYLREITLRNEYSYSSGGPHVQQSTASLDSRLESIHRSSLFEESEREPGMEDMKREWTIIQDEMHQKIQKYAELCINLNEEAENRNEEALNLHAELNSVSRQRNEIATEVESLRARIAESEKYERERRHAELLLQKYEEHGLDHLSREIGMRDAIIEDLSDHLDHALDSLSIERETQNQRRQVIFPKHERSKKSSAARETATEQELRATRDALQRAERTIELLRLDRG